MAYSITSITDDCDPGTTCLINKLDIRDETMLANAEASIVLAKASFLDQHPINGGYDFEHYIITAIDRMLVKEACFRQYYRCLRLCQHRFIVNIKLVDQASRSGIAIISYGCDTVCHINVPSRSTSRSQGTDPL